MGKRVPEQESPGRGDSTARKLARILLLPLFFVINILWDLILLPLFIGASIVKAFTGSSDDNGEE